MTTLDWIVMILTIIGIPAFGLWRGRASKTVNEYLLAMHKLFWPDVFILGGAIGNLIDRLAYGHVIDFIDFHIGGWHWPAFNIADGAITIGAALFVLDELRRVNR
mgnify:CR=1 FL=1